MNALTDDETLKQLLYFAIAARYRGILYTFLLNSLRLLFFQIAFPHRATLPLEILNLRAAQSFFLGFLPSIIFTFSFINVYFFMFTFRFLSREHLQEFLRASELVAGRRGLILLSEVIDLTPSNIVQQRLQRIRGSIILRPNLF